MINENLKCFIVTPIGADNTDIRRAADGVIDAVIIPSLVKLGFNEENIAVAHRMANPGSINKQIIKRIVEDDLVITNLTNLNPNVMYELALRHAVRKPVIQICEEGTKLPFDIIEERTIFYTNDMLGAIQLKDKLIVTIPEALADDKPDNPLFRVVENLVIQASTTINETDKLVLRRLDSLESMIMKNNRSVNVELKAPITLRNMNVYGTKTDKYNKNSLIETIFNVLKDHVASIKQTVIEDLSGVVQIKYEIRSNIPLENFYNEIERQSSTYLNEISFDDLPF